MPQRRRLVATGAAVAAAALVLAACTTDTTDASSDVDGAAIAASVFSTEVCVPKDESAIADIPDAVSGFTGYESAAGDWLTLPASVEGLAGKRVAVTVMGLGQPFFLAVAGHWEDLAVQYGFEVTIYDGRFDAGTVQQIVDDVIVNKPDAVVFAPLDSDASVPQVQKFLDAGIPTVTYNVQPREVAAPRVFADDFLGSQIVGCNAGAYFAERFGDTEARIGIVDLPELPQVQDRKNGFLTGFLSQVPTAVVVQSVNGGGVIDQAAPAAADLIQANPDINVIFGINDDSSLGTVSAMKSAGVYTGDWGVLAAVDGSRPAMEAVADPNSPYKAESGYPPRDFAFAAFNLLVATLAGETTPNTQVVVGYPPISPKDVDKWLNEQYPE